MTIASAEAWLGKRLWEWAKNYAKRYAELESRVTALEVRLETQPPEACKFCGRLTMRQTETTRLMGDAGKQWEQADWTCGSCGKTDTKRAKLK